MIDLSHKHAPVVKQYVASEASHLLKKHTPRRIDYPIGEIEVRPRGQSHISLGTFNKNEPPKGFTTHLTPNPQDDTTVTQVTRLDADDGTYELVLHIANYGDKAISAEIRQL